MNSRTMKASIAFRWLEHRWPHYQTLSFNRNVFISSDLEQSWSGYGGFSSDDYIDQRSTIVFVNGFRSRPQ